MKNTKKIIGIILASALAASTFAGCVKETKESSTDETTAVASAESSSETVSLLDEIKEKGVLTVGTEGTYSPFTYHDDSNKLVGYDVEVAETVGKQLGVKVEFVETKWDSIIAGLDAKRYDAIFNQVGITPERQEKYDFSTPYTVTRAALIVASDNTDITTFDNLKGKKSAQSLTSNFAQLAEKYGAELVGTDGFNQSIELVLSKRADATINDDISYYDYLKQKPDAALKIAATLEDSSKNAVLIRKGNQSFVEAVNKALAALKEDGTLGEISDKYFGTDVTE